MTLQQTSSQLFLATMNFLSHLSQSLAVWLVRAKHWAIQMNCWGGGYAAIQTTLLPQTFIPPFCYYTALIHRPPLAHGSLSPCLSLPSERSSWQGPALCCREMRQQQSEKEGSMSATSCVFSTPPLVGGTGKPFRQHHPSSAEKGGVDRSGNRARSTGSLGSVARMGPPDHLVLFRIRKEGLFIRDHSDRMRGNGF